MVFTQWVFYRIGCGLNNVIVIIIITAACYGKIAAKASMTYSFFRDKDLRPKGSSKCFIGFNFNFDKTKIQNKPMPVSEGKTLFL
jgi:hypothetical protein